MTLASSVVTSTAHRSAPLGRSLRAGQAAVLVIALAGVVAGCSLTGSAATSRALADTGEDLARLLRGMALLKSLLAVGVTWAVVWRLRAAATLAGFGLYALAVTAMALGPGLIWGLVYVRTGALLLHGGLLVAFVLLVRDPAVSERLAEMLRLRSLRSR